MDDQGTDRAGRRINRSGESFLVSLIFLTLAIAAVLLAVGWLLTREGYVRPIIGAFIACVIVAGLVRLFKI
jgi:hypothetical protein